jgi:hypothetical protein
MNRLLTTAALALALGAPVTAHATDWFFMTNKDECKRPSGPMPPSPADAMDKANLLHVPVRLIDNGDEIILDFGGGLGGKYYRTEEACQKSVSDKKSSFDRYR